MDDDRFQTVGAVLAAWSMVFAFLFGVIGAFGVGWAGTCALVLMALSLFSLMAVLAHTVIRAGRATGCLLWTLGLIALTALLGLWGQDLP